MSGFLSSASAYLSPSGSDDKTQLQAILDAGLPLILDVLFKDLNFEDQIPFRCLT
jgi:hypothetical protein